MNFHEIQFNNMYITSLVYLYGYVYSLGVIMSWLFYFSLKINLLVYDSINYNQILMLDSLKS